MTPEPPSGPAAEAVARYGWVDDDTVFGLGATVSLVHGRTPAEALELLVPDRATAVGPAPEVRRWADGFFEPPYATVVQAWAAGEWTVVVEESSGCRATLEGTADRLSERGRAVVVSCSINAVMWFGYAVEGALVRRFDPLLYDVMGQVGDPLPEEAGLAFASRADGWLQAAMVLMERLTGVVLQREDLRGTPAHRSAVGVRLP